MQTIAVASGGFDPVHSGHILMFNAARAMSDYLVVGINSDEWLARKKGKAFMPYYERALVVSNFKAVDEVMSFDDSDGSAIQLLHTVREKYPTSEIIFVNGGDRTLNNILELALPGVSYVFGVGGTIKNNSSSNLLTTWSN